MTDRAAILRSIRKRKNLSQAEMGQQLGIEAETVSAYERSKRIVSEPVWKLLKIMMAMEE
ncbi:helix-turn-helix domain-containing protein (plasmid) [Skermanella rosea]|uniref:helix-turn-helix domain-containing protein n=1 Tax=Skermanella rosea TaxID=1817965 RepID=UPI001933F31D|nr:helix-turn-helix domain-containing protein [Skermanella rosea]UEM08036.1 helix-turn-helix domain-containing protein [Skermanella rosea]